MSAPTRYEITARHLDGRAFLVAYASGSPSASRLRRIIAERADPLIRCLGLTPRASFTIATKPRPHAVIDGAWTVGYSGRTQREVRGSGADLPFIGGC